MDDANENGVDGAATGLYSGSECPTIPRETVEDRAANEFGEEGRIMQSRDRRWLSLTVLGVTLCAGAWLSAAPTPAQKKELGDISSDIRKVASLVSRKKFDEAEAAIKEAEERLDKLMKEGQLPETEPQVRVLQRLIETQQGVLAKASGGKAGVVAVSFTKDVAPILVAKCDNCHSDDRGAGGLKLESFASMKLGGRNGPVLVPGNPANSLIIRRITAPTPQGRMPKDAEALDEKEIKAIGAWIAAGAKFDGQDEGVALSLLSKNPDAVKQPKAEIVKATGNEKVSFTRDIAPTLVYTCGGCHGANNPRGGLSMVSFEKLMAGGESGGVIKPGKPDESRLWRLVNADEEPIMPQGNMSRITRKWHGDLRTWITEGAKFDGNDPKRLLRDLIPTPEQLKTEELAKLSPDQWHEKRLKDSKDLWTQSFPQAGEPGIVETADFIVVGDVAPRRLEEVGAWAQEHAANLRTMFSVKEEPLFKGKLSLFVFKDRFGYEEFNSTIHRRQVPREVQGHSDVTTAQDRALAGVEDIGDNVTANSPGLHLSVIEHVTGAFLKRGGGTMPDWLIRGTGLALAGSKSAEAAPYMQALKGHASDALRKSNISSPADVFSNGQFAPGDVGPIGFLLVDFLLKNGGAPTFGNLVKRFQAGDAPAAAIQTVYRTDPRQLGTAFAGSIGNVPSGGGNKKGK